MSRFIRTVMAPVLIALIVVALTWTTSGQGTTARPASMKRCDTRSCSGKPVLSMSARIRSSNDSAIGTSAMGEV